MSRRGSIEWTAPNGDKYAFKFSLKNYDVEISTVTSANGEITLISRATPNITATNADTGKQVVGYLKGYILKLHNMNFHEHADLVSSELQEFATALYGPDGLRTRVPANNILANTIPSKGGMLLIEKIEIQHCCWGMDMGINFIHNFLKFVRNKAAFCVMNPYTLSESGLQFADNQTHTANAYEGKSPIEKFNISRGHSIQLRKQLTRIGFRAILPTPQYRDMWILSLDRYKSNSVNPSKDWMSRQESRELTNIPIDDVRYAETEHDTKLRKVLEDIFRSSNAATADPIPGTPEQVAQIIAQMNEHMDQMKQNAEVLRSYGASEQDIAAIDRQIEELEENIGPYLTTSTALTPQAKDQIKTLVSQGGSLQAIDALHMSAANYKKDDLFEYLTGEMGMNPSKFDHNGETPLHVAVHVKNLTATKYFLNHGLHKNVRNENGLKPIELMEQEEECMADFDRVMGIDENRIINTQEAYTNQELKLLLQ